MTDQVARFADALDRLDVPLVRTTPADFRDRLADVVTDPAVGSPLPDPLGYDGTPVAADPDLDAIEAAATGVTPAPLGIADYGSVVVSGSPAGDEPVSLFADHHVAVLAAGDLVADMPTAIAELGEAIRAGHGDNVIATGPSATADMGDLVVGAHGPKRVTVVLVEGLASGWAEADREATTEGGVP